MYRGVDFGNDDRPLGIEAGRDSCVRRLEFFVSDGRLGAKAFFGT